VSYSKGELTALPVYQPGSGQPFQMDLREADLSKLDLTGRAGDLLRADFDVRTKWPAQLPAPFDPARIMELGRNPGLGLRALHARGITGKGVGLAVVDMGLLTDHVEFADRLKLFEEIQSTDPVAQMHGCATASIAPARRWEWPRRPTSTTSPLTSWTSPSPGSGGQLPGPRLRPMAQAINRLLDINRTSRGSPRSA